MIEAPTILDLILEEHKSFLLLMSDIAGHAIDGNAWLKVRSCLSPNNKFTVCDPVSMTTEIFANTEISINKHIEFKARGQVKLYLTYKFPGYESAACCEFLLRGAPFNMMYALNTLNVEHGLTKGIDDPNKVFGMVNISRRGPTENPNNADTLNKVVALLSNRHP